MCVYIHIYAYICVYVYIYIYTCIYKHIYLTTVNELSTAFKQHLSFSNNILRAAGILACGREVYANKRYANVVDVATFWTSTPSGQPEFIQATEAVGSDSALCKCCYG